MNTFRLVQYTKTEESILSKELNLSICLRASGFSFSLVDSTYKLRALGEFDVDLTKGITSVMSNLKDCFAEVGIRMFNFISIKVICQTDKNVWIPFKLYDNTKDQDYLREICDLNNNETILSNVVDSLDAVSVFTIPLHQYSGMKILAPKAKYMNQFEVLASYGFGISSFASNTFILHKRGEMMYDCIVFKGNYFVFSNSFECKNESDMLYFILFTLSRLNLDTAEINLLLTGEQYTNEEKLVIRQHIKNISYANPMENIKVGFEFDSIDLQRYILVLI
jgi:hypothetical protein